MGVDSTRGYVTSTDGQPTFRPETVDPEDLDSHEHTMVLDVRATSEYEDGHVPDATQLHGGRVMWQRDELPDSGKIVTYCQSGMRSSVVASSLRSVGYDVTELKGSYSAWEDAGMPTEK